MKVKVSRAQYEVLSRLAQEETAKLYRISGGFWVTDPDAEFMEGDWHANTQLVTRLRSKGLIRATNGDNSPHVITDAGVEALKQSA